MTNRTLYGIKVDLISICESKFWRGIFITPEAKLSTTFSSSPFMQKGITFSSWEASQKIFSLKRKTGGNYDAWTLLYVSQGGHYDAWTLLYVSQCLCVSSYFCAKSELYVSKNCKTGGGWNYYLNLF